MKIGFLSMLMLFGLLLGSVPSGSAQTAQEWSEPVNLSMSGAASNPFMVVDSNGVVHVIWLDQFDGFKYVQSADNGATWTTPVTVKYPFSADARPPMLLSDPRGIIHIFWLTDQNKLSYAQSLADNFDTPASWLVKTDLDNSVFDFDASLDPQGRMHVAYLKNPAPVPGTAGVYYKRSADSGDTWAAPQLLYESTYFRSLNAENARIRLAVSEDLEDEHVHIVWDDRQQKRIFISTSLDGGLNWEAVKEMVAPQANLGFQTPYNADVDVVDGQVLATWLVGEPGVRCTAYSWSSSDGGETWGEQTKILPESAQCPERSEFLELDPQVSVSLYTIQGELYITAWNGSTWSFPEIQTGLSSITNPATFDTVLLGCEQAAGYNNRLFVVGCDENTSGDIWFIWREMDALEELFPMPSEWSGDATIITVPRSLTSLTSVTDNAGSIHAIWIQSSYLPTDTFAPRIEYARWNGVEWSSPSPIITTLTGMPQGVSLQIDSHQRLLLSWVNEETGELMFTWANSERASIPMEWISPITLSFDAKFTNSPDIVVDATDRIVIAYAVTLNEERGIYLIQSSDLGETWSQPVKIFDAVLENWDMVDQPKLAVTQDGTLHILFSQYIHPSDPQAVGLYYSQSTDGGVVWTTPEAVSSQSPIQWSEIISVPGALHRFWQEKTRSDSITNHQSSSDGGKTWGATAKIPGGTGLLSQPYVVADWAGKLHILQIIEQDNQILQEWEWSSERWQMLDARRVGAFDLNSPPIIKAGIISGDEIYALIDFESAQDDGIETQILQVKRSLALPEGAQPFLPSISTPSAASTAISTTDIQLTPTQSTPLTDLGDPQPVKNTNIVGFILIVVVVSFILILTIPRRTR
jgi:hypothetical protein